MLMNNKNSNLSYVLITPARNEADNIEKTINSVISQTIKPNKWIIVSDASTDNTDNIVKKYLSNYDWIKLIRMPEKRDRQFAAKVECFNSGFKELKGISYDIIGNLDGDISFENDYLEFLLKKFEENQNLGVAGTPFIENEYDTTADSFEGEYHVAGGCQLFRKECFKQIGGYKKIRGGGIDWTAVTTARMMGWETRSFNEKYFFHHRALGTGESNQVYSLFSYGKKDWFLGNHPLWEVLRICYRMTKKPYLLGGFILGYGYFYGLFTSMERSASKDLIKFHRKEQMKKLSLIIGNIIKFKRINKFSLKENKN